MRPLSIRLQAILNLIKKNADVADIGTDHAYLPIALRLSGKVRKIIACDIKEKPLQKAKENIKKFGIDSIELRLCDGISGLSKGEVNTIVIAGMGGDVICRILSQSDWIKDSNIHLILQPMTSAELVREHLINSLFEIKEEVALCDQGKIYTVMSVYYSGINKTYEKGFIYTGLIKSNTEEGKLYLLKQHSRFSNCVNDLSNVSGKEKQLEDYKEILKYIEKITES